MNEVCFNEGKDWIAQNPISGARVYQFLYRTKKVSNNTLAAVSKLTPDVIEASGVGYARKQIFLGAVLNGVLKVPNTIWQTGTATNWPSDITGFGIASALTGGVAIYCWDFTGVGPPYDMSGAGAQLAIPQSDFFFFNPGEA